MEDNNITRPSEAYAAAESQTVPEAQAAAEIHTVSELQADNSTIRSAEKSQGMPQNKMGYMPCNKLLVTLSLPIMLSMIVQALYNIVDSIFVSQVCEEALTAVSLAFPIQMLCMSIILGTGVGVNARLSAKLGERQFEEVNITAGNAITINLMYTVLFALLGVTIVRPYFNMMTEDPLIRQYGYDYMTVVLVFGYALIFQVTLEKLLQSTGKTLLSMASQLIGAVTNIILDPVFIFGLFGVPAMGTKGAAIATVIGQTVACIVGITANLRFNREIRFAPRYLPLRRATVSHIYAVGIPSIIMQSIGSVMNLGMNMILLGFSSTAAAVFGVYYKLQSFVFMPVFGLNSGVIPIISFNYGARKPSRIKETFRLAVIYATVIMTVGMLIFEIMPASLLSLFNASDNMIGIGSIALRCIAPHFVLAGFAIVCSAMFQSLGHGIYSLWVSIIRQIAVLLPCAFILAKLFGLNAVWLAFPIAELASFVVSFIFIRRVMRNQVDTMKEAGAED